MCGRRCWLSSVVDADELVADVGDAEADADDEDMDMVVGDVHFLAQFGDSCGCPLQAIRAIDAAGD